MNTLSGYAHVHTFTFTDVGQRVLVLIMFIKLGVV